jgi:hypothetical protein
MHFAIRMVWSLYLDSDHEDVDWQSPVSKYINKHTVAMNHAENIRHYYKIYKHSLTSTSFDTTALLIYRHLYFLSP